MTFPFELMKKQRRRTFNDFFFKSSVSYFNDFVSDHEKHDVIRI